MYFPVELTVMFILISVIEEIISFSKRISGFAVMHFYLRNNSWKPYVYIVFTTGRPLCHEVLPRA
jgi:hypothetical protein